MREIFRDPKTGKLRTLDKDGNVEEVAIFEQGPLGSREGADSRPESRSNR
jgi:hypothetical protein